MSALALELIKKCILTQNPYLELGSCGLDDHDFTVGSELEKALQNATHIKTLILSNGIFDADDEWVPSQNNGNPNFFTKIPRFVSFLKDLKILFCNGDINAKFRITEVYHLSGLKNLIWLDLRRNEIQNLQSFEPLTELKILDVSYNKVKQTQGLERLTSLKNLNLSHNQIQNIDGLEELLKLEKLTVNNNWLTSLTNLSNLSQLCTLSIHRNKITTLSSLKTLQSLVTLQAQNNKLHNLKGIENLQSLQYLDVKYNEITSIEDLRGLEQLIHFDVKNNQLVSLEGIKCLKSLEHLETRGNYLEDLNGISIPKSLKTFDTSRNFIRDIGSIKDLYELTFLDISNNEIEDIAGLAELAFLQHLEIDSNNIYSLLPLQKLTNLDFLYAQHNRISSIEGIENLIKLKRLNLSSNRLKEISDLSKLTSLKQLDISINQIETLPNFNGANCLEDLNISFNEIHSLKGLENLKDLKHLNLDNNQITDLKPITLYIEKLVGHNLRVKDNPLIFPPIEVVNQGTEAIINYFSELEEQGSDFLYEAKLLIVGQPRAGKTTLRLKIFDTNAELPIEEETTRGIDINRLEFAFQDNEGTTRNYYCNVWDFGGQQIYQATHQFFLTQRSLYVLVMDTGRDDDDNVVNYWLQAIELLAGNSPLLLVRNEKNQRQINIDIGKKQSRFSFLKKDYRLDLNGLKIDSKTFERAKLEDFKQFKEDIERELKRLPLVGMAMPKNWVQIRNDLQSFSLKHNFILKNQYIEICNRFNVTDYEKQMELSRIFHDLGIFLHFQDYPMLEDFIILHNTWATDSVFTVLDNQLIKDNNGKFSVNEVYQIWKDKYYDPAIHSKLLALMMQFELCYKLEHTWPHSYIIPEMLADCSPVENRWGAALELTLLYRYDFMPKGILTRLIVRLHRYIEMFNGHQMVWKTGVYIDGTLLDCPNTTAEITETWNNKQLSVRIQGFFAKDLMNKITFQIDELNGEFFRNRERHEPNIRSKWYKMIPCNCIVCTESNDNKHFYDYAELVKRKEYGKETIECKEPPFETVNISQLLEGIFSSKQMTNNTQEQPVSREFSKKTISIFLASSSELEEERNRFEIYIGRENKILNERGIFLKLEIWEDFLDSMSQTRLQDRYNETIKNCDIFVMLYFSKVGKYTLEEFETAFKAFKQNNKPLVYTYFKKGNFEISKVKRDELNSLLDFQDKLKELGHFQTTFDTHSDLHFHFKNQLERLLLV